MGLRCLLGHDFGELQTDRDRRERGNEVVVTIREYRECDRCGETRVVSENKEVRHASPAGSATTTEDDATGVTSADASTDDLDEFDGDDVSAEEDDGIILEDEPEAREPGAWPEADTAEGEEDDEPGEPAPWPEVEGEDEGFSARPSDGGGLDGVQFGSGLTPEATASEASGGATEGEVIESSGGTDSGGFRRATSIPSSSGPQRTDESDTEFFCPECEHTTPTAGSSLRPGDICPNCRLGYLTERKR